MTCQVVVFHGTCARLLSLLGLLIAQHRGVLSVESALLGSSVLDRRK
jgi:hypothetical protein